LALKKPSFKLVYTFTHYPFILTFIDYKMIQLLENYQIYEKKIVVNIKIISAKADFQGT